MNNLLQSQILESCKLSLPEGLKDLMSDISREVLRAQPQNLYQFIANYLDALLHARDALTIACHICNETCECACERELENELREIGLDEDVNNAVEIIMEHFKNGPVKEQSLFLKLLKETCIDEDQITAIQEAVQRAFKRNIIKNTTEFENKSNNEAVKALNHTIKFYDERIPKNEYLFISSQNESRINTESTTSLADSHVIKHIGFAEQYTLSELPEKRHENNRFTSSDRQIIYQELSNERNTDNNDNVVRDYLEINNELNEEMCQNKDSIFSSVEESIASLDL